METAVSIRVRAGHESDAPDLARIHYEAVRGTAALFYPGEVLDAWSPEPSDTRAEAFRRALAGGDELFVVAEQEGRVVGFGSLVPSGAELRSLYVAASAGRRGIGSRLLQELERLAVDRSIETLQLVASLNAERFYTSRGYESVKREIHRVGGRVRMACLRMQKSLRSGAASLGSGAADQTLELAVLERRLAERRFESRVELATLLADEFREFGCSGREHSRGEVLDAYADEVAREVALEDFCALELSPDLVLATYRTEEPGGRRALRSSLWTRREGRWKLVFHQGTLEAGAPAPKA